MITQMLAANGFMDGIVSSRARTGKQGITPGQNLFSSLLTKAGSSLEGQTTGVTQVQTQKTGYVDQLKDKLLRSGANLEEITLEPEAENHIRALLLLDGYSTDQVEEIVAGFGEEGKGMTASELFSRIAQFEPEDAIFQQGKTLEVSAIPHLEKALFLTGLDAEQSQDIINNSLTTDGKISLEKMVYNLNQILGDVEEGEPDMETALGILEALDQAGIKVGGQDAAPITLKDVLDILKANATEDVPGLPGISKARLLSHFKGVVDNAVVEEDDGEGLVPLSKLIESKLKFIDEEDFEDVPVVYVEMALRRMGVEPAEAGRLAAQVTSGGAGTGRVLVNNLSVAEKFKESLPPDSVPAFERLIQEMAKNGELTKNELSVSDFSEIFASMDLEDAMQGLNLQGSDELENLAALLTQSLQKESADGSQTQAAAYLEKISVPQTLVELRDLLLGLSKSGKTLPEAAANDLAQVLKQAGAEPTLVDDLIAEAKIAEGEVDPAKLAKSMERVAQSVLILATEDASNRIDNAYKSAELSNKFAGIMQVLQNTRSGFLSEDATQYIAKVLEDMGVETHEVNQALSQNRFPSRGVDPVPVIEVVKKIAQRMGIDSESITEASIRTGIQDPDTAVARVDSKGQAFAFMGQDAGQQGKGIELDASTGAKTQKVSGHEASATLTADESEEAVITVASRKSADTGVEQAAAINRNRHAEKTQLQADSIQVEEEEATLTGDMKITGRRAQVQASANTAANVEGHRKTVAETDANTGSDTNASVEKNTNAVDAGNKTNGKIAATIAQNESASAQVKTVDTQTKAAATQAKAADPQAKAAGIQAKVAGTQNEAGVQPQAPSQTKSVQEKPEVVVKGAERVHQQGDAASSGQTGTTQVKTVETVQVENRDGQRVQVRSNDVYVKAQAEAESAGAAKETPQETSVKGAAAMRADLGDSKTVKETRRNSKGQVNNVANTRGQKAAETGDASKKVQQDTAQPQESDFAETLNEAATRKVASESPAKSGDMELESGTRVNAKVARAVGKGGDTSDTQAASGKGSDATQSHETQGNVQSFQQELTQAAKGHEAQAQRPVLRAYEGQMGQQLGNQVVQALNRQENRIRLQLHPKQLGAVDVHLNLKKNVLSVGMSAETEHVKEILLSQVTELKHALSNQGIVVDKIEVNVRQNPEQNLAQQQQGGGQGQQAGNRGTSRQSGGSNPEGFVGLTPPRYQTETGLDVVA